MRAVSFCGVVCLAGGILAGTVGARADDCSLAVDATIAQAKVPHAVSHVMTAPGKPAVRVEMIFAGDKAYSQMNGTWRSMPYSAQEQIDTINAARKRAEQAKHTCQKLASEPINGEAASLMVIHSEVDGKISDMRLWIADGTGLPLKSEIHLASGTVVTDDFRYRDIKAPPDVK
jgi:hypothetical protein